MPQVITSEVIRAVAANASWQKKFQFRLITQPGAWADAANDLMEAEFSPDVLDPFERLEGWLLQTEAGTHEFPFLWAVAYIDFEDEQYLLGTFDGNLMPVVDWALHDNTLHAPPRADGSCIFVVGRQATAKAAREAGVRGVGRSLFEFSANAARDMATAQGRTLRYLVLESEERSKIFWSKMGFLWPEGTLYIQPPLEFDEETGKPVRQTVDETLMFRPVNNAPGEKQYIEPVFVRDTIATIYTYWSLHPFRATMQNDNSSVLRMAEEFVMVELLGRIEKLTPQTGMLPLVEPPE